MSRLTWADLLIQDISAEQFRDWLAPWTGVVEGRVAPVFLNKFDFWFFLRSTGQVEMLDVFSGRLERAADNQEAFLQLVNEPWWQEAYLLSEFRFELHGPAKCRDRASATPLRHIRRLVGLTQFWVMRLIPVL